MHEHDEHKSKIELTGNSYDDENGAEKNVNHQDTTEEKIRMCRYTLQISDGRKKTMRNHALSNTSEDVLCIKRGDISGSPPINNIVSALKKDTLLDEEGVQQPQPTEAVGFASTQPTTTALTPGRRSHPTTKSVHPIVSNNGSKSDVNVFPLSLTKDSHQDTSPPRSQILYQQQKQQSATLPSDISSFVRTNSDAVYGTLPDVTKNVLILRTLKRRSKSVEQLSSQRTCGITEDEESSNSSILELVESDDQTTTSSSKHESYSCHPSQSTSSIPAMNNLKSQTDFTKDKKHASPKYRTNNTSSQKYHHHPLLQQNSHVSKNVNNKANNFLQEDRAPAQCCLSRRCSGNKQVVSRFSTIKQQDLQSNEKRINSRCEGGECGDFLHHNPHRQCNPITDFDGEDNDESWDDGTEISYEGLQRQMEEERLSFLSVSSITGGCEKHDDDVEDDSRGNIESSSMRGMYPHPPTQFYYDSSLASKITEHHREQPKAKNAKRHVNRNVKTSSSFNNNTDDFFCDSCKDQREKGVPSSVPRSDVKVAEQDRWGSTGIGDVVYHPNSYGQNTSKVVEERSKSGGIRPINYDEYESSLSSEYKYVISSIGDRKGNLHHDQQQNSHSLPRLKPSKLRKDTFRKLKKSSQGCCDNRKCANTTDCYKQHSMSSYSQNNKSMPSGLSNQESYTSSIPSSSSLALAASVARIDGSTNHSTRLSRQTMSEVMIRSEDIDSTSCCQNSSETTTSTFQEEMESPTISCASPPIIRSESSSCSLPLLLQSFACGHSNICDLILENDESCDDDLGTTLTEKILENFHRRFDSQHVYTSIGDILVFVNPMRTINIYSPSSIDVYKCHCLYQLPPHIFAMADKAWRFSVEFNQDQMIVLSGHSGSGKTETSKLITQYISVISPLNSQRSHTIKRCIVHSNQILEAFGNAQTKNNRNSSRFGKCWEFFSDFKGDLIGAEIRIYNLEKARATSYANQIGCEEERNFHIFYQLLKGADMSILKAKKLSRNVERYNILRMDGRNRLEQVVGTKHDDFKQYQTLKEAMFFIGFSETSIDEMTAVLAFILRLGNVIFKCKTNIDETRSCNVSNFQEFCELSATVGLNETKNFEIALTSRQIVKNSNDETIVVEYSERRASQNLLILIRTIYSRLFSWIVSVLNDALEVEDHISKTSHTSLGIIDLYGFENLTQNCFDQLLINYTAEKQYQITRKMTVIEEQEIIISEGLEWHNDKLLLHLTKTHSDDDPVEESSLSFMSSILAALERTTNAYFHVDNKRVTKDQDQSDTSGGIVIRRTMSDDDLLEQSNKKSSANQNESSNSEKSSSESSSEDEVSRASAKYSVRKRRLMTSHLDKNFMERMETKLAEQQIDSTKYCNAKELTFKVEHFKSKTITYNVKDFVRRNIVHLDSTISTILHNCDNSVLKSLFPEGDPQRLNRRRPQPVINQFKSSLSNLIETLRYKQLHFVMCMKPSESLAHSSFDDRFVREQMINYGVVEMAMIKANGFTSKLALSHFMNRYKMLCVDTWPFWNGSIVEGAIRILTSLPIDESEYQIGRTMVFIKEDKTMEMLEEWRRSRLNYLAVKIQARYRGYKVRLNMPIKRIPPKSLSSPFTNMNRQCRSTVSESRQGKKSRSSSRSSVKQSGQRVCSTNDFESNVSKDVMRIELIASRIICQWIIRVLCKRYLVQLSKQLPSKSPLSHSRWPRPPFKFLKSTSNILRRLYHKWRCRKYRDAYDQISRNRMREKVTASIIFSGRKQSYEQSIKQPFRGDYSGLKINYEWRQVLMMNKLNKIDNFIVFDDVVVKMNRKSGKFVPMLFVVSTNSMLILDLRTMQIKYRIPIDQIYKMSLSPFCDDIAVIHVTKPQQHHSNHLYSNNQQFEKKDPNSLKMASNAAVSSLSQIKGCLRLTTFSTSSNSSSSSPLSIIPSYTITDGHNKGDFVIQTVHVIEIVTKLFLVVQNATGQPPAINISTHFEANFGFGNKVFFTFHSLNSSLSSSHAASSSRKTNEDIVHRNQNDKRITSSGNDDDIESGRSSEIKLVKKGDHFDIFIQLKSNKRQ